MQVFTRPTKTYAGYIFDCDGTLANSMPIHFLAWQQAMRENGCEITEELFYSLGGVPTPRIVEILNEKFGLRMDPQRVSHRKEEIYLEQFAKVEPIPEVAGFAREVVQFAKVSVASGGVLPVVQQTLEVIGFGSFFPVIVTSEQVARGKPFPDIFLEAARRMEVPASDCLVLEDSPAGIEAAKAAEMDFAFIGRL
jgi:HAD superfamily hydrolase (TIGR01509 family)